MSAGSQWAGSKCRQGALLVMYVCITHTHTYSRRWTVGQLIHVHLMLLPLFICCFIAAAPGQFMCVCVAVCCFWRCARVTCHVPIAAYWASFFRLLVLSPSSVLATAVCQGAAFYVQMICTPASAFDFFSFIVSLFIVSPWSAPHTLSENQQSCS